jgi:hypothetical protein
MNSNLTANHVLTQVAFKFGQPVADELKQYAQGVADGTAASPLYTLDEIKLAIDRVHVQGTAREAAELVDMLSGAGEQRGDMMLEYTTQVHHESHRALLRELGVPVPCECGASTCVKEMEPGCGHFENIVQLELQASLVEDDHDQSR